MVTKNRLPMVRRAVRCFQNQSYRNRELVIVNDADDGTEDYVKQLQDERVVYVRPPQINFTLGELRNLSIRIAGGKYVTQWDDDDWYHPERIEIQLAALLESGSDMCLLERWTLAWPERNLFYYSKRRSWEGSMLAEKEKIGQYPPLRRGEDTVLLNECVARKLRICAIDRPELYIYVVHGINTWDTEHFLRSIFDECTGKVEGEELERIRANLFVENKLQRTPCWRSSG